MIFWGDVPIIKSNTFHIAIRIEVLLAPLQPVNVNGSGSRSLAITKQDFGNSGELGPQATRVYHMETSDNCVQLTGPPPVLTEVVASDR